MAASETPEQRVARKYAEDMELERQFREIEFQKSAKLQKEQDEEIAKNGGKLSFEMPLPEEQAKEEQEKKEKVDEKKAEPPRARKRSRSKKKDEEEQEEEEGDASNDEGRRVEEFVQKRSAAMNRLNKNLPGGGVYFLDPKNPTPAYREPQIAPLAAVKFLKNQHLEQREKIILAENRKEEIRHQRREAQIKRRLMNGVQPRVLKEKAVPPKANDIYQAPIDLEPDPIQVPQRSPWPEPAPKEEIAAAASVERPSEPTAPLPKEPKQLEVLWLLDPTETVWYREPVPVKSNRFPKRSNPLLPSDCLQLTGHKFGRLKTLRLRYGGQEGGWLCGSLFQISEWYQHWQVYEYLWQYPDAPLPTGYSLSGSMWGDLAPLAGAHSAATLFHQCKNNGFVYMEWRHRRLGFVRLLVSAWSEYMFSPEQRLLVHHTLHIDPTNRTKALEKDQEVRNQLERRNHHIRLSPDTGLQAWHGALPQPAFLRMKNGSLRITRRFREETKAYLTPKDLGSAFALEGVMALAYMRTYDTFLATANPESNERAQELIYLLPPKSPLLPPEAYLPLWNNYFADLFCQKSLKGVVREEPHRRTQTPWNRYKKVIKVWLKDQE